MTGRAETFRNYINGRWIGARSGAVAKASTVFTSTLLMNSDGKPPSDLLSR